MKQGTLTKDEKFKRMVEKYCKWHRWFAWYPVKLFSKDKNKRCTVWLQYVGRKKKIIVATDNQGKPQLALAICRYCLSSELLYLTQSSDTLVDASRGLYDKFLQNKGNSI